MADGCTEAEAEEKVVERGEGGEGSGHVAACGKHSASEKEGAGSAPVVAEKRREGTAGGVAGAAERRRG